MLPTYFISCLARKHVKVALSGDGGDEAFAGYDRYRIHLEDRAYRIPQWAGSWYRQFVHPLIPYRVPGVEELPERPHVAGPLPGVEQGLHLARREALHRGRSVGVVDLEGHPAGALVDFRSVFPYSKSI